ncbi:MAG: dTDP-4-dehydrorhamnose reductase [Prochlorococcus sp. SP3034]|nr:dTDP-4-dehydrorhamnose reductase [Prochlorococcus sp. SP3034]
MKVLLTGTTGQLGQEIIKAKPSFVELIAPTRRELDLADTESCRRAVQLHQPDWVINSGAYTAVDKAEDEKELAMSINAIAPKMFSEELSKTGGKLLQLSTDFVFDGKQNFPYKTDQKKNPIGVYGATKAAGEDYIYDVLGNTNQALIIRTSWLIGTVGKNFMKTMIRLHRSQEEIRVVSDQIGCPTSTLTLAKACWRAIEKQKDTESNVTAPKIQHWSDEGSASWYELAKVIGELALRLGLIERQAKVIPISSKEYPTPAKRPKYSILDCTSTRHYLNLEAIHWKESILNVMKQVSALNPK